MLRPVRRPRVVGPALIAIAVLLTLPTGLALAGAGPAPAAPHRGAGGGPASGAPGPAAGPTGPVLVSRPAVLPAGESRPLASAVDPYFRSGEPAPMGIADYGINAQGIGYSYSTPIFQSYANISRLLAWAPTDTEANSVVTFQLNVVVKLVRPAPSSGTYAFWIQDVVDVDTAANGYYFLDNIWNLSAGTGAMDSHSVQGKGTVCTYSSCGLSWYYYTAPTNTPGDGAVRSYPTVLEERVQTGLTAGNVPYVGFEYFDPGVGWITYDNCTFPFASGFTDAGFTVDGSQYTPIGVFWNAEWDYTGTSGSSAQVDRNTSMQMGLEYWNGHDFQALPEAYDFGANTAEVIQGVHVGLSDGSANGSLTANVSNGSGELDELYTNSDVATLQVSTPDTASGTIAIGGAPHPYLGGSATFTLAPGTYPVVLEGPDGVVDATNVTLAAGGTNDVTLRTPPPPALYSVSVVSSGLPPGTAFGLTLGGSSYSISGNGYELPDRPNGTYDFAITPIAGYTTSAYRGTLTVDGASVELRVAWTQVVYPVTFTESGLPDGTAWSVVLDGSPVAADGPSVTVSEANGSIPYTIDVGITYEATPATGTVAVDGGPVGVPLSFTLRPGYITGTVDPPSATVLLDGQAVTVEDGVFNVSVVPGSYTLEVIGTGFATSFENVSVGPGATTSVALDLNPAPGAGGGSPAASSGPTIGFVEALLVIGAAVAVAAGLLGVVAWRRRAR